MSGNRMTRRPRGKKGPAGGSGGMGRRRLEGKGPTPKAEDRVYHPAHKRKLQAEAERRRAEEARHRTALRAALQLDRGHELIVGRNPVVEAVRSGIPLTRVFMSGALAGDERLGEVVRTATALGAPLVEVSRAELDRMTDGAVHQGVAIDVPPHEYAGLDDLVDPQRRGVDLGHAVFGGHEFGDGRIVGVAAEHLVARGLEGLGVVAAANLARTAGEPRLLGGRQQHAHVGVGRHDRRNVPALGDYAHVGRRYDLALAPLHLGAHAEIRRDLRDDAGKLRLPYGLRDVHAVAHDLLIVWVERHVQRHGDRRLGHGVEVVEVDSPALAMPRRRPIHGAGVEVAQAEPFGHLLGDG